jgi:hypothetical protein
MSKHCTVPADRSATAQVSRVARAILLAFGLVVLAGCARTVQTQNAPGPTLMVDEDRQNTPAPATASPAPTVDAARWQPPFPRRLGGDVPTPTPFPGRPVITYAISGLLVSDRLEVMESGATNLSDSGRLVATMTLTEAEVADLWLLSAQANLVSQADEYIEPEDPSGMIVEYDYRHIHLSGGRLITLRGEGGPPDALRELDQRLADLAERVRAEGQQEPRRLIGYWLRSEDKSYSMEIDLAGTVFFDDTAAGRLPAAELEGLQAQLSPELVTAWEEHYWMDGVTANIDARIVNIYYRPDGDEFRTIDPSSRRPPPAELERLLVDLAEIYDRYHP